MIPLSRLNMLFTLVLVFGLGFVTLTNFVGGDDRRFGINLGLDLQGGSHLLLEVDVAQLVEERLDDLAESIRADLRNKRIAVRNLRVRDEGIEFGLIDRSKSAEARSAIARLTAAQLMVITPTETGFRITNSESGLADLTRQTVAQAIEIIRSRVDETGTKEPIIQRQGTKRIVLQLPGVDDPEQVKALLGRTAKLGLQLVDVSVSPESVRASGRVPPGSELLTFANDPTQFAVVKRRVLISGEMLLDAQPGFDSISNEPIVAFTLNAEGAERFGRVTAQNIGRPFAIILDDEVISTPVIRGQIFANGQISGDFSVEETNDLSLLLRSGALPAPLAVVEERAVGPGLGSDSVAAGRLAAMIGLFGVAVFMIACYGMLGVIAVTAVLANIMVLFGQLSLIQATLTLPGIAGIVLTIGMAVDANVIIFERIKEELARGYKIATAIKTGFSQATSTIIDANLTTLAAALFLIFLGSGPIKGFSVTLSFGVISSVFSAIFVTYVLLALWINIFRPTRILAVEATAHQQTSNTGTLHSHTAGHAMGHNSGQHMAGGWRQGGKRRKKRGRR
ncbi:MAG: protein translocase subunit SecD [Proteobacteria bacterium]|nr:protein translocase subunit SecD [Pseudomonadota bacterium]